MPRSEIRPAVLAVALAVALASPVVATPKVALSPVACLPTGGNAPVRASVEANEPDTEVRVFFRRLSDEVEDFYSLKMQPAGGGRYWAVLPRPSDQPLSVHNLQQTTSGNGWAAWWKAKEGSTDRNPTGDLDAETIRRKASVGRQVSRSWMSSLDDAGLESFLSQQSREPAELYAAVYGPNGDRLAISATQVAAVRDDCPVTLTDEETGYAENLVVGETAMWQQDEQPFHWQCDGVVSRQGPFGVLRADDVCRGCIARDR